MKKDKYTKPQIQVVKLNCYKPLLMMSESTNEIDYNYGEFE